MSLSMEVDGDEETAAFLRAAREGIPVEIRVGMDEGLAVLQNATTEYPPQRPPANPQSVYVRGVGTRRNGQQYYSSERYGASQFRGVERYGREIVGYLNMPASYSKYLRGDMEQGSPRYNRPAWMHVGVWRTLVEIVNEFLPDIVRRLEKRLQTYFNRLDKDSS